MIGASGEVCGGIENGFGVKDENNVDGGGFEGCQPLADRARSIIQRSRQDHFVVPTDSVCQTLSESN